MPYYVNIRQCVKRLPVTALFGVCLSLPAAALEIYSGNLAFETKNQSAANTLTGISPPLRTVEYAWHKTQTGGAITGSENAVIIPGTPPTPAVKEKIWIPKWEWKDKGHYRTCHTIFGSFKCWKPKWKWVDNGHYETITVIPALPGTPEVTGDTRTGAKVTIGSAGRVAVKSSLGVNGGKVDAALDYTATIKAPDTITPGEAFRLSIDSHVSDGSLKSLAPSLTGKVSTEIDWKYYSDATGCVAGAGCSSEHKDWWNLTSGDMEVLEFNTPNTGENKLSVFDQDSLAFPVPSVPIHADAILLGPDPGPSLGLPGLGRTGTGVNLATLELNLPTSHNSSSIDPEGNLRLSHTSNDVISLQLDLDTLALMSGIPLPPAGFVINGGSWPASFSIRADAVDFGAGPTFDIVQDLKLSSTLMVDLTFDNPIKASEDGVNWSMIDAWTGRADSLPYFSLDDFQTVNVDTSFWLDAELKNLTDMLADVSVMFDMGNISISIAGAPVWSGHLFGGESSQGLPVVQWSLLDQTVPIGGFNRISGPRFTLAGDMTAANNPGSHPATVPEPGSLSLLMLGLLALVRRQLTV